MNHQAHAIYRRASTDEQPIPHRPGPEHYEAWLIAVTATVVAEAGHRIDGRLLASSQAFLDALARLQAAATERAGPSTMVDRAEVDRRARDLIAEHAATGAEPPAT